ncbi:hypothetical protein ACWENR_10880 [Micromonospora sp. NPDC004336]
MAAGGDVESLIRSAIEELGNTNDISVERRPPDPGYTPPPDRASAFREIVAKTSSHLDSLEPWYFESKEFHVNWQLSDTGGEGPLVVGEFCLQNLHRALTAWQVPLEDVNLAADKRKILAELKVIDDTPYQGAGRLTGLRVTAGAIEPELWYYDMSTSRLERLDLNYGAYIRSLLITKGTSGWQYLFADVDLTESWIQDDVLMFGEMLRLFPRMFPNHQYAELQERLEARR